MLRLSKMESELEMKMTESKTERKEMEMLNKENVIQLERDCRISETEKEALARECERLQNDAQDFKSKWKAEQVRRGGLPLAPPLLVTLCIWSVD